MSHNSKNSYKQRTYFIAQNGRGRQTMRAYARACVYQAYHPKQTRAKKYR